jgi:hypothetical protein
MGTNRSGRAHINRLKRQRRDAKRAAAKHAALHPPVEKKPKPATIQLEVKPKPAEPKPEAKPKAGGDAKPKAPGEAKAEGKPKPTGAK